MKVDYPFLKIADCRESIPGIGVVWPVESVVGRCGCGRVEMKTPVAFFVRREDAELYIGHPQPSTDPLCSVKDCGAPGHFCFCGIWICKAHEQEIRIQRKS